MSELTPLREMFEEDDEELIATPLDEVREWVAKFLDARERRREATEEEQEAKDMIRSIMEADGAEFGTVAGQIVLRRRTMTVRRFNTKRFRKDHQELADAYTDANEEVRMEVVESDV